MASFVLISKSNVQKVHFDVPNELPNNVSIGNTSFYFSDPYYNWKNANNDQFYILGNIIGFRKGNKIGEISHDKCEIRKLENLRCIRPGMGLPPKYFDQVLGCRINKDVTIGTPLQWKLLMS